MHHVPVERPADRRPDPSRRLPRNALRAGGHPGFLQGCRGNVISKLNAFIYIICVCCIYHPFTGFHYIASNFHINPSKTVKYYNDPTFVFLHKKL